MKPTTTDTQTQEAVQQGLDQLFLQKLNQLKINQFYKIYNVVGEGKDDEEGLIALRNGTAQQPESNIHKVLTSLFKSESGKTDEIRTDIKWKETINESQKKHENKVKRALESLNKDKFDVIYRNYKKDDEALHTALTQNLSKKALEKKMASPDVLAVWKALLGAKQQELQKTAISEEKVIPEQLLTDQEAGIERLDWNRFSEVDLDQRVKELSELELAKIEAVNSASDLKTGSEQHKRLCKLYTQQGLKEIGFLFKDRSTLSKGLIDFDWRDIVKRAYRINHENQSKLKSIKKRNNTGYLFQGDDISTLVTALQKKNGIPSEGCILIPGITTDQRMRDTPMPVMLEDLPSHEKQQGKTLKVAIPFQMEHGNHWNLITATFEVNKDIILRQQDTDGPSRGIEDSLLDEFKRVFEEKGYTKGNGYGDIKTLSSTEQTYSFSGQRGINCGIVTALMAYDYFVQKRDYAGIITSNKSDGVIRNEVSTIVFDHAEELQKVKFCQPQTSKDEVVPGAIESFEKIASNDAILDKLNTLRIDQFYQIFNAVDGVEDINDDRKKISRLRALRAKTASQQESELHKVLSNLFKSEPNDPDEIRTDIDWIPLIYASHKAQQRELQIKVISELDEPEFDTCIEIYEALETNMDENKEAVIQKYLQNIQKAEIERLDWEMLTERLKENLSQQVLKVLSGLNFAKIEAIYYASTLERESEQHKKLVELYDQKNFKEIGFLFKDKGKPSKGFINLDWRVLVEQAYQSKKTAQGNNLLATSISQDLLNIFKNPTLYILLLIGAFGFWKFGLLGAIVGISLSINVIQLIDIIERKLELESSGINEDPVESSTLEPPVGGARYTGDMRDENDIKETPFPSHKKGA